MSLCLLSRKKNPFGPMYIDFDEYPCYSGRDSENFVENVNNIFSLSMVTHILQVNKICAHELIRTVGK